MSVSDVFKSMVGGATIACTVVCGHVQTGDRIMLMPGSEVGSVKCMSFDEAYWVLYDDGVYVMSRTNIQYECILISLPPLRPPVRAAIEVNGYPAKWAAAGDHVNIVTNSIDLAHVKCVLADCKDTKSLLCSTLYSCLLRKKVRGSHWTWLLYLF